MKRAALWPWIAITAAALTACNDTLFSFADDSGVQADGTVNNQQSRDAGLPPLVTGCTNGDPACFECTGNGDCFMTGLPECDVALGHCVECVTTSVNSCDWTIVPSTCVRDQCVALCSDAGLCRHEHCSTTGPLAGLCVQCSADVPCQTGRCKVDTGRCVECLSSANCPPTQVCDINNECRDPLGSMFGTTTITASTSVTTTTFFTGFTSFPPLSSSITSSSSSSSSTSSTSSSSFTRDQ